MLLLVAGCGSNNNTSSPPTGGATGQSQDAATAACVAKAQAIADDAKKPLPLEIPTDPVSVKPLAGKNIWFLSANQAFPFQVAISTGFKAAAQAAGMKATIYDTKGQVSGFNQGLSLAVAQHAAGVVLQGIDPNLVKTPLAAAKAQGIAVIDSFVGIPSSPLLPGVLGHVATDYPPQGEAMAAYVLAQTGCKADTVSFTSSIYPTLKFLEQGIKKEFATCPQCKLTFEDIDPSTIATRTGSTTIDVMRRDPGVNSFLSEYDALAQYMVPALANAHSKLQVVSHDGNDSNMTWVKQGHVQSVDFAFPPTPYIGWAEVDQLARVMQHQPPSDQDTIPAQLFDTQSLNAAGSDPFPAYDDYPSKYEALWGVG